MITTGRWEELGLLVAAVHDRSFVRAAEQAVGGASRAGLTAGQYPLGAQPVDRPSTARDRSVFRGLMLPPVGWGVGDRRGRQNRTPEAHITPLRIR